MRSDNPSNTKTEDVLMFHKDYLLLIRRDDLCTLSECIVTEINWGKNLYFYLKL